MFFIKFRKNYVANPTRIIWQPFEGAQRKFMTCPTWECLLHGNRGGGKTDVLLMDYAQGIGRGYGQDYRGLLLREATTELGDVIAKSKKWFPRLFPGSRYNRAKKIWEFIDGETLWFNYARLPEDYDQYHGHEYPWIGWEELTNQPLPDIYLKLMSCNRSSNPDIFIKYRGTCNPSGPGHAWVKQRFIDAIGECKILKQDIEVEVPNENGEPVKKIMQVTRTHIRSHRSENKALVDADPLYEAKLYQMTEGNDMLRKAWVLGSWNLIIGGFFTDVWNPSVHVIKPFNLPKSWTVRRSFDWGSSKPWSVTYGVESSIEEPLDFAGNRIFPYKIPKGSIFVISELYGWTGVPNEGDRATSEVIANRVINLDAAIEAEYGLRVFIGPADNSIWDVVDGSSIGKKMGDADCHWLKSYKGAGSRISGWAQVRNMLYASVSRNPESPHLYFFAAASNHIRTLPLMQRDKKSPEDIDTDLEDHAMDSLRYLLTRKMVKLRRKKVRN